MYSAASTRDNPRGGRLDGSALLRRASVMSMLPMGPAELGERQRLGVLARQSLAVFKHRRALKDVMRDKPSAVVLIVLRSESGTSGTAGTRMAAKVFSCPQPGPRAETSGDIGTTIEHNIARAWLRSGIVAPISEQCGMAHDIDALAVLMAGHSVLGVWSPFQVTLENSALCKLSSCTPGITPSHQRLPAFARDQVLDVALALPDVTQTLMDHLIVSPCVETARRHPAQWLPGGGKSLHRSRRHPCLPGRQANRQSICSRLVLPRRKAKAEH